MLTNLFMKRTHDGSYTILVDGLLADGLTKDEALGLVASVLFTPDKRPMYAKSPEEMASAKRPREYEPGG